MLTSLKTKAVVLGLCLAIVFGLQCSFVFLPILKTYAQVSSQTSLIGSDSDITGNSIPDITGIQEEVDLTVTPENPQPGDTINANIQAPGLDLNTAQISWLVNGVQQTSGKGVTSFTTQAGPLGKTMTISVKVFPSTGAAEIDQSETLSTQDVDIIWEASSYFPPFYKGKSLYGQEGDVTFVAMPNIINKSGAAVSPSSLVYEWSIDGDVIGDKSGYGKNVLDYSGSIIGRQNLIEVDVTAPDGTTGEGNVLIEPRTPITLLYEDDPLYGVMFNRAITDGYKLNGKEIRVDAYPFFYSADDKNASNINYQWSLNDNPIPTPSQKNSALFRNSNNVSGSSKISVNTTNSVFILQQSETDALLNF